MPALVALKSRPARPCLALPRLRDQPAPFEPGPHAGLSPCGPVRTWRPMARVGRAIPTGAVTVTDSQHSRSPATTYHTQIDHSVAER